MIAVYSTPQTFRTVIGCCLLAIFLVSCGGAKRTDESPAVASVAEQDALESIEDGRVLAAVRIYETLAESSNDAQQRQHYELKAVETLFDHGYPELAIDSIAGLSRPNVTPRLTQRREIVETRAAVALGEPERALELLPADTESLAPDLRVRAEEARAQAHTALGDAENALLTRIKLEALLDDDWLIERNHKQIWYMLDALPDIQLASLVSFGRGAVYQGWIELAQVVRNTRQQNGQLRNTIPAWLRRYSEHPASGSFAISLIEMPEEPTETRDQIALLLPLNGKLSEIAGAVRDGLFAAYYADTSAERPEIRIYDTSDTSLDLMQHYSKAVSEGARAIIGPLDKQSINQLAAMQALPVPTLGLNYTQDASFITPENLFQFGLLPEDEARAVADFAFAQGHTRALALTPNSQWGRRLVNAFQQRFVSLGGVLLDYQPFNAVAHDFSKPITQLLNLNYSRSRRSMLQNILGKKLEFEPRRRQDSDFIFLAAAPKVARQMKPQLKFHRGGDLPVYATSRAFSAIPDGKKDSDMEGILICDIPWILNDARDSTRLYRSVDALWPQRGSLARLYALGIDAYQLLPHLQEMAIDVQYTYPGRTGDLTLGENNRIHRQLRWAQFIDGVPVRLPDAVEDEQSARLDVDG